MVDYEIYERTCDTSIVGLCQYGLESCHEGQDRCDQTIFPADELCDGLDNDCDGEIDENLTRPCETLCGAGEESCLDGSWTGCTAPLAMQ
jgi:hypothetical protein